MMSRWFGVMDTDYRNSLTLEKVEAVPWLKAERVLNQGKRMIFKLYYQSELNDKRTTGYVYLNPHNRQMHNRIYFLKSS